MSGPVSPPLATTESGTSTIVRPTNTLEFNGADFTVTGSGSKATISIDSTGTGAALTATQVGFGDSSNLLTGSTSLTFDDTNKKLTITGDADNDAVFEIIGSDSAADAGPRLRITNDTGTDSALDLLMDNFAVGILEAGTPGGTMRSVMQFGQMSSDSYTVVFNEDGLPADFRIEGDTNQNLFFVDGGQDAIGIGAVPDSGVERLEVVGAGSANPMVQFRSTETGASASPHIVLYRNNTGVNNNDAGSLEYAWDNSADTKVTGAAIYAEMQTVTPGAESNRLRFYNTMAGTQKEWMRVSNGIVEINAFSENVDFKIEGDSAGQINFYSDASQDNVGIGGAPSSGGGVLQVFSDTPNDETVRFVVDSTIAQKDLFGPIFDLVRTYSDGVGQDGAEGGRIRFRMENDNSDTVTFCDIMSETYDVSAGSEDGILSFRIVTQGTALEYMRLTARDAGSPDQKAVVINEVSQDIGFRVESDGLNPAFMVNSGLDNVGIGTDPSSAVERLHVKGTSTSDVMVRFEMDNDDAVVGPTLDFYRNSASPAAGDDLGLIKFSGNNSSGSKVDYATVRIDITDTTAGGEDADFNFFLNRAGVLRKNFRIRFSEVVVNEDSTDCNFRVEGNGDASLLVCDAGLDKVAIGQGPNSTGAQFQVEFGASFLRETSNTFTANHDVTADQAHGHVLVMDASSGASNTFTLPEVALIGMHVKLVNLAGSNGMTVAVSGSSSHQINGAGTAGSSSVSTTTKFQTIECHYVATNVWVATEPAVAA